MEYQTKMIKGSNGWKATTDYSLGKVTTEVMGEVKEVERVLRLSTAKAAFNKYASSFASVHTVQDSSHGYKTECHAMGLGSGLGDFSRTILKEAPPRITEKVIADLHCRSLSMFPLIIEQAKEHYAAQAARAENV